MDAKRLNESVQETAKLLLHLVPAYESHLKKATGRSWKAQKPMLFSGETVTLKLLGKRSKEPGSIPDAFVLELTYDPGPDLYRFKSSFYKLAPEDGKVEVAKGVDRDDVYWDQMEDPKFVWGDVRSWAPSPALKECLGGLLADLKTLVEAEMSKFDKLVKELSKRPDVKNPAALAAWIGRKKLGAAGMAKKAAAGRK